MQRRREASGSGSTSPSGRASLSPGDAKNTMPQLSPRDPKHARVVNCLDQLQSLNLERPEGMVVSRSPDEIIRKLPRLSSGSSAGAAAARARAVQYHEDIEEMIELHREFSRSNQKLWKKVTRAVHVLTSLSAAAARRHSVDYRDPLLHAQIAAAFDDHQAFEKERLSKVKSAFQLLKESGDKNGRIKKSKMNKILESLGVEQILEVAKKKESSYSMSIMERVNMCADYWLEKVEHTHLIAFDDDLEGPNFGHGL